MPPHVLQQGLRVNAAGYIRALETVFKPLDQLLRWHRGGRTFFSRAQLQPTRPKRPRSGWLRISHDHVTPDMWPPSSPDLTPLCGVVEENTNKCPDNTNESLKGAFVHVISNMQEAPLIHAYSHFRSQMGPVIEAEKGSIE